MEISSLLKRFFQQQCNPEEVDYLLKYLDENPDILNEYLSENEWQLFESYNSLSKKTSLKIWNKVLKQTINKKTIVIHIKRFAVAASFLLISFLTWILIKSDSSNTPEKIAAVDVKPKITVNNTKDVLCFYLSDGTFVKLMPQSSLTYPNSFINKTRDLSLVGEAVFHVAKDPSKPFTVYSDAISTTALGTIFKIKSFEKDNTIQVILDEGKVVIKSAFPNSSIKQSYLHAGQIYTYAKTSHVITISNSKINYINLQQNNLQKFSHKASELGNNWYMFNNQSLAETLDQLSLIYGVKIDYDKSQVKGMTFIGKIDKSDSLQNILSSICLLNKLTIQKTEAGFIIKK